VLKGITFQKEQNFNKKLHFQPGLDQGKGEIWRPTTFPEMEPLLKTL